MISRNMDTTQTNILIMRPATPAPVLRRPMARPLIIIPSKEAGRVVNQLNHPMNGSRPIIRNKKANRLTIRPTIPNGIPSLVVGDLALSILFHSWLCLGFGVD